MTVSKLARVAAENVRQSILVVAMLAMLVPAAFGQDKPVLPDRGEIAQLVWTFLIAVDQANQTGNYSVLSDLGTTRFQNANDPAKLAGIFANLRQTDIGLARTVLYAPEYSEPPQIQENGMLRVKGLIPMRPEGVMFDMLFQKVEGEWRLSGIGIAPEEPRLIEGADGTPTPRPGNGDSN